MTNESLLSIHNFHVWNEGIKYKYGTKQRVLTDYMLAIKEEGYTHVTYTGPAFAVGGYAIANAAEEVGLNWRIFMFGKENKHFTHGLNRRNFIFMNASMRQMKLEMWRYVDNLRKQGINVYNVPLGADNETYIDMLRTSIEQDDELMKTLDNLGDIWIAVGSGVVLSVLVSLFPNKHFHAVSVTKLRPSWVENDTRITLYRSPLKATQGVKTPFPSISTYDAKVWPFMVKYAKEGDVMFNIASDA